LPSIFGQQLAFQPVYEEKIKVGISTVRPTAPSTRIRRENAAFLQTGGIRVDRKQFENGDFSEMMA